MNRIIVLTIILWIIAIMLTYYKKSYVYLLLPLCVFILNEISYAITGFEITPAADRTALFYDLCMIPTKYFGTTSGNYTEGYWPDGDYSISAEKAENNKFDKIIELLGAKSGDKILDLGCGTCSMALYFKTKGITVVGLTLSPEQAANGALEGIEVHVRDFTKFYPDFVNKYDHIVSMGSCEHLYGGPMHFKESYENKNKVSDDVLNHCYKYLKPNGNIFYSVLHLNPKYMNTLELYDMERMFGSTLFLNTDGYTSSSSAKRTGFKVLSYEDRTHDYYMATLLDKHHFGNATRPFSKSMLLLLLGTLFYPQLIFTYLYGVCGIWMYMFDGKTHTRITSEKPSPPYSYETNMDDRPWTLWWGVFNKPI